MQDQAKMEALAKCVFPLMIEDTSDALKLALCFPKARTAVRTASFWMPWLRRNCAELREFISSHPQYAHLADVISSTQYQLLPPAMLKAGGVCAVVESKRNHRLGPRIEPLIYLEEHWSSRPSLFLSSPSSPLFSSSSPSFPSTHANIKQVSICYRHDSVQIISSERFLHDDRAQDHWDEQWYWKSLRYHGRTQNLPNRSPIRSGKGVIYMSNNARFEGEFEYFRGSNMDILPTCSVGLGSLIWEVETDDGTKQLQQLTDVECMPAPPQHEWGDLQFRHAQQGVFHVKQTDGILHHRSQQ